MNNITQSFTDALADAGIVPTRPIIGDGLLHRCHVEGDRAGTLNLAYVLHLDGKPAGWWMYFKTGVTGTWTASGKNEPMTAAIKRQIADAKAAREQEKQKAHQAAKAKAQWIWEQATPITEQSKHPYLARKRVQPHGIKAKETWGFEKYSSEVSNYTKKAADNFKLSKADEEWADNEVWSIRWKNSKECMLIIFGGLVFVWLFSWIVGWIVRGFLGIPTGQDTKP